MSGDADASSPDDSRSEQVRFSVEVSGTSFTILESGTSSRRNVAATLRWAANVVGAGTERNFEDPKHRGPAYQRGRADGRMEALADVTDPEVPDAR